MKGASALILVAALLVGFAALSRSNSSVSISVPLRSDEGTPSRYAALSAFAGTHDWDAEFRRRGLDIPDAARDQILEQIRDPLITADASSHFHVQVRIELSGLDAWGSSHARNSAACALIEARLRLEAWFAEIRTAPDAIDARSRIWRAFGSGFDPEVLALLREYRASGPHPELVAFVDTLIASLEARTGDDRESR